MSRLFISHSLHDQPSVIGLLEWLGDEDWTNLYLNSEPDHGLGFDNEVNSTAGLVLSNCEAALFLISPEWIESSWCIDQFQLAKDMNKPLFGLIVAKTDSNKIPTEFGSEWPLINLIGTGKKETFGAPLDKDDPSVAVKFNSAELDNLKNRLLNVGLDTGYFPWPPADDLDCSPYPGLGSFQQHHAGVFYGRDAEIMGALDAVRALRSHNGPGMLFVHGESSVGKSSLLLAGLLPRLEWDDEHFIVLPPIHLATGAIHGSQGLIASLSTALQIRGLSNRPQRLMAAISQTVQSVSDPLDERAGAIGVSDVLREMATHADQDRVRGKRQASIIISIDQMGDLYSSGVMSQNEALRRILWALAAEKTLSLIVLGGLHNDEMHKVSSDEYFPGFTHSNLEVPPLPSGCYAQIIANPAERYSSQGNSLRLDGDLIERLLDDVVANLSTDTLAKTAFALERLFLLENMSGHLTLEAYEEMGGINGAVQSAFEHVVTRAEKDTEPTTDTGHGLERLRRGLVPWFPRAVFPHERVTRRSVVTDDLPSAFEPFIGYLVRERLFEKTTTSYEDQAGQILTTEETISPRGDLIFAQWDMLRNWLSMDLSRLHVLEGIRSSAQDWVDGGREPKALNHRLAELENAERQIFSQPLQRYFAQHERAYVQSCRIEDNAATSKKMASQNTAMIRMRIGASFALLFMLFSIGFGYQELQRSRWATQQKESAEKKAELAQTSMLEKEEERQTANGKMLTAQASEKNTNLHLKQSHENQVSFLRARAKVGQAGEGFELSYNLLVEATKLLVTAKAGDESIVKIARDLKTMIGHDRLIAAIGPAGSYKLATFSPDGQRVATISTDNSATIWDAATGVELVRLDGHTSSLNSLNFSSDGKLIVTASFDKTARIWDVQTGRELSALSGHVISVNHAAFSPDSKRLVTASLDSSSALWDTLTGTKTAVLLGHRDSVNHAAFSPDGRYLVTSSNDARIWDAMNGTLVATLSGHSNGINYAMFSPDNSRVITASDDKTAIVWDAKSGAQLAMLSGHEQSIGKAIFSPDGSRILTISSDGTSRLWDAATYKVQAVLTGHSAQINAAQFSRDGDRIITGSNDKTARIWDAFSGKQLAVLGGHVLGVNDVRFSNDGKHIVSASNDVKIWNARRRLHTEPFLQDADVETTIIYAAARQIDRLSDVERKKFHLSDSVLKKESTGENQCDAMGRDPLDLESKAPSVTFEKLKRIAIKAVTTCEAALVKNPTKTTLFYQAGRAHLSAGNINRASAYFNKASLAGHPIGFFALARMKEAQAENLDDLAAAFKLYLSAMEAGFIFAAERVGQFYWTGEGTRRDRDRAVTAWQAGVKMGDPGSHGKLARLYAGGSLIRDNPIDDRDLDSAYIHYNFAAQLFEQQRRYELAALMRRRSATIVRLIGGERFARVKPQQHLQRSAVRY